MVHLTVDQTQVERGGWVETNQNAAQKSGDDKDKRR